MSLNNVLIFSIKENGGEEVNWVAIISDVVAIELHFDSKILFHKLQVTVILAQYSLQKNSWHFELFYDITRVLLKDLTQLLNLRY